MGYAAVQLQMTSQDFLAWDATQTVKHEFVRGEVFAMAGASEAHVTLTLNLAMALRQHLRGTPCRSFITDMKLRVEAADAFFYPDVMVCCSAADASSPLVKRDPVLLVEVLSPSTEAYDRGEKFASYRLLPNLREVVLIDPASRRCEVFQKRDSGPDQGLWVLHPYEPGQDVVLRSVDLTVTAERLWDEVPPVEPTPPPTEKDAPAGPHAGG